MGDGSLIAEQREYLRRVQTRVREHKASGRSADETAALVTDELRTAYPDWAGDRWIDGAARSAYREAP